MNSTSIFASTSYIPTPSIVQLCQNKNVVKYTHAHPLKTLGTLSFS